MQLQKIVIAKWLAKNCKILLFDEPTRGIDVAAKAQIWKLIDDFSVVALYLHRVFSHLFPTKDIDKAELAKLLKVDLI